MPVKIIIVMEMMFMNHGRQLNAKVCICKSAIFRRLVNVQGLMSVPSLHIESTDSLMYLYIRKVINYR